MSEAVRLQKLGCEQKVTAVTPSTNKEKGMKNKKCSTAPWSKAWQPAPTVAEYKTCCFFISPVLFYLVGRESHAPLTCGPLHLALMGKPAKYGPQMFIWWVIYCWCCIKTSVLVDWPNSDLSSPGISRKLWRTCNCGGNIFSSLQFTGHRCPVGGLATAVALTSKQTAAGEAAAHWFHIDVT